MKYFLPILLFFAVITAITFGKSLHYEFMTTWDDDIFILKNPVIHELSWDNIKTIFTEQQFGLLVPVLTLSLAVDYQLFGTEPWGYRLNNLILHTLNMGLVFYIFSYFLDIKKYAGRSIVITAAIVAILWGIHPLRVESVVWISQRRDVLSGFFCLLSMALYMRYSRTIAAESSFLYTGKKDPDYFMKYLSVLFFILAVASKPSVVAFPVVLVLLDFYPLDKIALSKKCLVDVINSVFEKIEFFIVSGITAAITIMAHSEFEALHSLEIFPLHQRLANAIYSVQLYFINTVLPAHLLPFYPRQEISLIHPLLLTSLAVIGYCIYLLIARTNKKTITLSIVIFGSFIAMLLPILGFFQAGNQGAGDRFTYIATIPFFICLGVYLLKYMNNRIVWAVLSIWALLIFMKTWKQQEIWQTSVTLFTEICEETPFHLAFLHNYLGKASQEENDEDTAIMHYQDAINSDGQNDMWAFAANNLGNIYNNRNSIQSAEYYYERALSYDPDFPDTYCNLGIVHLKGQDYDQAIQFFKKAISLNPDYVKAIHNTGFCHLQMGRHDAAEPYFIRALELEPDYQLSQDMLARLKREREEIKNNTTQSAGSPPTEE